MRVNSQADMDAIMNRGGRGKRPKFNNVKTKGYDSNKEYKRAQTLKYWQNAGIISELKEQPRFELIPRQKGERAAHYTADFQYMRDGKLIVEDVKSEITRKKPDYVLRRKLMLKVHGITVLET